MSTVKISELPVLSSADAADEFVVVDDSAGVTKKITFDSLATDVRTESEPLTATTVTASGLVTASSGITFGADTLDDYEEGTWTPVLKGDITEGSYTLAVSSAEYQRIGNFVYVNTRVTGYSESSPGSGVVKIEGLPFLASDFTALALGFRDDFGTNNNPYGALTRPNLTEFRFYKTTNSDARSNNDSNVNIATTTPSMEFIVSGTYKIT